IYGSYWGMSYSKVGSYQCGRCSELGSYIWKAILVTAWTLISIMLAIRGDQQEQNLVAIQTAWSKQLSQRRSEKSVLQSSSSARQMNQSQQLSMRYVGRSQYSQQQKKSQIQEKGSLYIKVFTNYLQIMGCIITLNPSLTTRGTQQNGDYIVEVSPTLFAHSTERSPVLFCNHSLQFKIIKVLFLEKESIVDGGVDMNFKQEKEGKFMTMIEKDMISLSDKTIPSNNKIPHKINFTSQQNNDEDML
ncbi:hypothetical protein ABPG72_020945, partial [Tetrahymena utriculariae]